MRARAAESRQGDPPPLPQPCDCPQQGAWQQFLTLLCCWCMPSAEGRAAAAWRAPRRAPRRQACLPTRRLRRPRRPGAAARPKPTAACCAASHSLLAIARTRMAGDRVSSAGSSERMSVRARNYSRRPIGAWSRVGFNCAGLSAIARPAGGSSPTFAGALSGCPLAAALQVTLYDVGQMNDAHYESGQRQHLRLAGDGQRPARCPPAPRLAGLPWETLTSASSSPASYIYLDSRTTAPHPLLLWGFSVALRFYETGPVHWSRHCLWVPIADQRAAVRR